MTARLVSTGRAKKGGIAEGVYSAILKHDVVTVSRRRPDDSSRNLVADRISERVCVASCPHSAVSSDCPKSVAGGRRCDPR